MTESPVRARTVLPYESPLLRLAPGGDLADWIVAVEHTPFCDEIIEWSMKVILVDTRRFNDLGWSLAHAFAHIDLGHHQRQPVDGAPFSCEQERDADGLAKLRLDMEWDDDGEEQRIFDLPEAIG